jgi:hypothetical protein
MHPIFQIDQQDIQALNDSQARELLARLCQADLIAKGLGTAYVTWGGDQRAKDGGVDVRVDITPAYGPTGYIPNDATAYQVKAEVFNPAKIPDEMAPKGILRNVITEFSSLSGAYIIVSTKDNLSDSSLRARKKAMTDCLAAHGLAGKVYLDFYDSRKIADWVEGFPALVVWLRSALGRPLQGWQPYGPWAYYESNVEGEYLLDDKIKVLVPNVEDGIDIENAINRLRSELRQTATSVRIVGLSGVGKTRLVQALFDKRILTSTGELNPHNVLYTDLSHNPTPQPIAMLEALKLTGSDSVVVVDNCGQEVHQQLTEIIKRKDSKLRLVTIEYDIRDDLPEGTSCYQIEGTSDEIIAKLLKRRYDTLSDIDISKIAEFSGGNARVAFALASTAESKGELAHLTDNKLFERLFLQKHSANDQLQKCAEAASLLYSFDAEDVSDNSELSILAGVAEVTISTFFGNLVELQRRGLVQERGKWRAVLPHAISNRLALKAVQGYPTPFLIQKFVTTSSERVARSFSRRLGYLHELKQARDIAQNWLAPHGFLGDVPNLTEVQRQMLANIAPLNQRAALDAILLATMHKEFIEVSNLNRAHFSKLLRSLAYEPELFEEAAKALLQFALVEPENHKLNSVRDTLKSLFSIYLSGTLAVSAQRAAFVRKLVFSADGNEQELGLRLLRAALQTHHFSSHHGFDFGALKRGYGWHPKTDKEIQGWYELFVTIATDIGANATLLGASARSLLGNSFRGLWSNACIHVQLTEAARKLSLIDGWPAGWIGIQNTLRFDKSKIDDNSLAGLLALEKELAPQDLKAQIQAKVLTRGDFSADSADVDPAETATERRRKVQHELQRLGNLAALDSNILCDLTPYISGKEVNEKVWSFGFGIGQSATSCAEILAPLRTHISAVDAGQTNSTFIRGLIAGWGAVSPEDLSVFLDQAVEDDVWGMMFPDLQLCMALNDEGYLRLMRSITLEKAPCWKYRQLGYGRATDPLTVAQIGNLLSELAVKPDQGLEVVFGVLRMVIHCSDTKDDPYRTELQAFCMKFVAEIQWDFLDLDNDNLIHEVEDIIEFAFTNASSTTAASTALANLVQVERGKARIMPNRLGNILLPFFKVCPMAALEACYFQDGDGTYRTALRILAVRLDRHGDSAVGAVPESALIDWCYQSPVERFIFAARTCKLFDWSTPGEDSVTGIASTAMSVLRNAPDKKEILNIFLDRFHPLSWSGSLAVIMRQRMMLLDQLKSIEDSALDVLIEEAKSRFSRALASEEEREEIEERSRTGSFE